MTIRDLLRECARSMPSDHRLAMPPDGRGFDATCTGVTHDSRQVQPGMVFVALRGLKSDGTAFIPAALAAGAAAVVAQPSPEGTAPEGAVVVSDARLALAFLSAAYFNHPSREMTVVGITGTNGKTTTAYLVSAIFDAAGMRSGLMGTVTYRVAARDVAATRTTPEAPELQAFMRRMADDGSQACVMEVSSHALTLRRVDGIRFAAAVFTNLTRDHLDFHKDMEQYFAAKRRLFEMLPEKAPALINADDPRAAALGEVVTRPVTYAISRPADVTPGPLSLTIDGLQFDAHTPQGTVRVRSRLVGRPNVYNILAAVGTTAALGVPLETIERGLTALAGVPGRFEIASAPEDDIVVVVDYAHTDDALRNLLETARPLASRRLTTVFGAGGDRDRTKRPLMGMVAARLSDLVLITSDNPRSEDPERIIEDVKRGAEPEMRQRDVEVRAIVDRREAIHHAIEGASAGDLVLIAGKGHETYQEIGGQVHAFDDVAVAREALRERRMKARAR